MADRDTLAAELARVRALRRRRRALRSRLDAHRVELIALRALGASINDLTLWLRQQRRVVVHRSSVVRALRRWAGEPRA
jgi:hypothetical protein